MTEKHRVLSRPNDYLTREPAETSGQAEQDIIDLTLSSSESEMSSPESVAVIHTKPVTEPQEVQRGGSPLAIETVAYSTVDSWGVHDESIITVSVFCD